VNQLQPDTPLSLRELFASALQFRWWLLGLTIVGAVVGAGVSSLIPTTYQATVVVANVSRAAGGSQLGMVSSLAAQLGGLASIAGLGGGGDPDQWEAFAVLQSRQVTERFISERKLEPIIVEATKDEKRATTSEAHDVFAKKVRSVVRDNKTGMISLTIKWREPAVAADWANGLVQLTNDFLRQKAIDGSDRNIAYLTEEAGRTTIVEIRQGIYSLIQSEISKSMLARGSDEYALKIIDPAAPPNRPSALGATVSAILGASCGLIFGFAIVFLRAMWRI
jgi:uncharacterized protein involved in exopolysaccharide biosynthesis